MHVAIIDYGSGNLHSAAKAFERAAREQGSDLAIKVTARPEDVADAERIVLPGVGAFADCKRGLEDVPGMIEALEEAVQGRGKPFLGICVGLQLMAERGLEHGVTPGLGWIKGEVRAIAPSDPALKIPHMGWNTLRVGRAHALLDGHPNRRRRAARLFRALLSCRAGGAGRPRRQHRLWRPDHRVRRQGQYGRHPVPPREEPEARARADREFPEMEAVILFPAIDLKDGQCVRLRQGEMDQATVFNEDPTAQARSFEEQGFEWLHVVDLNGAFEGRPVNEAAVEAILAAIHIPVQLGGGIRDLDTIVAWLDKGIDRVILGTAAVRDPALVKEAARDFPGCIAVGIDARDGKVAVEGWAETSEMTALDLARRFEDAGVAAIVYTDIARDGVLAGPQSRSDRLRSPALSRFR